MSTAPAAKSTEAGSCLPTRVPRHLASCSPFFPVPTEIADGFSDPSIFLRSGSSEAPALINSGQSNNVNVPNLPGRRNAMEATLTSGTAGGSNRKPPVSDTGSTVESDLLNFVSSMTKANLWESYHSTRLFESHARRNLTSSRWHPTPILLSRKSWITGSSSIPWRRGVERLARNRRLHR